MPEQVALWLTIEGVWIKVAFRDILYCSFVTSRLHKILSAKVGKSNMAVSPANGNQTKNKAA